VRRQGGFGAIKVSTSILLLTGMRAGVLAVTFSNSSARVQKVPVQFSISGNINDADMFLSQGDGRTSFDYVKEWSFRRPDTTKVKTDRVVESHRVILHNTAGAVAVASDLDNLRETPLSEWSFHWETTITLGAGEHKTHYLAIALGPGDEAG